MAGKVVVFGAGSTGRGHVGLLAWQAGFELILVDSRRALADLLRDARAYRVRLLGALPREVSAWPALRSWPRASACRAATCCGRSPPRSSIDATRILSPSPCRIN